MTFIGRGSIRTAGILIFFFYLDSATNGDGLFDLFHRGHENVLRCAPNDLGGTRIMVGILCDALLSRRKGIQNPVDTLHERMATRSNRLQIRIRIYQLEKN
jgi:phosphopantetheine adenylyltransferase